MLSLLRPTTTKTKAICMTMKSKAIVEDAFVYDEETHLTVSKTSLFFPGDGFCVYDSKGKLVFRVDSYGPESELVLMNPVGRCILTVRRKRPSLHQRWEGFIGERTDGQKPLFSIRSSRMVGRLNWIVDMFTNPGDKYHVEGSFVSRNCTIFNSNTKTMAQIRRKVDRNTNVMLGKDVFTLSLKPGFDGAFAMGLVLVLDQIHGVGHMNEEMWRSRVNAAPTIVH